MIGRDFDEDQHQAIRIGHAKLDEAPRLFNGALDDRHAGRTKRRFGLADVSNLKPKLGRRRRRLDLLLGELQVAPAEKEDDAARVAPTELAHGVKPQDVAIKTDASVEVAWVQHETAREDLHRSEASSLHCPETRASYISGTCLHRISL